MTGVFPGSFDPCTNGHLDIIKRSAAFLDKLFVVVLVNNSKQYLFTLEERINLLEKITKNFGNIEICSYDKLLVNFICYVNADVIVRGLRSNFDFDYEFKMYLNNKKLNNKIETVFLPSTLENMYITSSYIKEIAFYGGDVSHMVPKEVNLKILSKYNILED